MRGQVIAAALGHGGQAMVGQRVAKNAPRGHAGAQEAVSGGRHTVGGEGGLKAPAVEAGVVGHKREPLHGGRQPGPHRRERIGGGRVARREAVHAGVPVLVVVGRGAYQMVKAVRYRAAADHNQPHRADTGGVAVRGLEIDGSKV